jgi:hypothetical protein
MVGDCSAAGGRIVGSLLNQLEDVTGRRIGSLPDQLEQTGKQADSVQQPRAYDWEGVTGASDEFTVCTYFLGLGVLEEFTHLYFFFVSLPSINSCIHNSPVLYCILLYCIVHLYYIGYLALFFLCL